MTPVLLSCRVVASGGALLPVGGNGNAGGGQSSTIDIRAATARQWMWEKSDASQTAPQEMPAALANAL